MPTTTKKPLTVAAEQPSPADLCDAIASSLRLTPNEQIRVKHLWNENYRVNWLTPDLRPGDMMNLVTYKTSKSQFIHAVMTPDGLVITDKTIKGKQ